MAKKHQFTQQDVIDFEGSKTRVMPCSRAHSVRFFTALNFFIGVFYGQRTG
jgi:hypothetical protein